MTNKELQEILKQWPDSTLIWWGMAKGWRKMNPINISYFPTAHSNGDHYPSINFYPPEG